MFEKRVVLIQVGLILGILPIILGTISLMETGILPEESINIFIIFEMVGGVVLAWILIGNYQRGKVFKPLIEKKLNDKGYTFVSERPLSLIEILSSLDFSPTITINGMPIQSFGHKACNERMICVKTDQGKELLLYVVITTKWSNEIKLEIVSEKSLKSK
ncbi:MAG: hypothetical protein J0L67_13615 [Cytophagales bacterium]|nr:hypothetical protein [Cytophagales bacterium]